MYKKLLNYVSLKGNKHPHHNFDLLKCNTAVSTSDCILNLYMHI